MQDLVIAWPGLLIGFLEFVLGALWVFASVLQRRKTGFILLAVGTLGSSAVIVSEQVYRVTVMLHHAPGKRGTDWRGYRFGRTRVFVSKDSMLRANDRRGVVPGLCLPERSPKTGRHKYFAMTVAIRGSRDFGLS